MYIFELYICTFQSCERTKKSRSQQEWKNRLEFFLSNSNLTTVHVLVLKGTVSQDFRWELLYINRKLFSTAIVGRH